mgnify:CR=1 FL=1
MRRAAITDGGRGIKSTTTGTGIVTTGMKAVAMKSATETGIGMIAAGPEG